MIGPLETLLAGSGEVALTTLAESEIVKYIPILGSSFKMIKSVHGVREKVYLSKLKKFIDRVGDLDNRMRSRLIEESKLDSKRRIKFGDALYTALEQSDSLVKVEYLAAVFTAFLKSDLREQEFRLICHVVRSSFVDELLEIVESENPAMDLPFGLSSGLYTMADETSIKSQDPVQLSAAAMHIRDGWMAYGKKRKEEK